ncbi:MAG TPA: type III-B CRISPR module-associated Cmr3 family protein [Kofleriaceae bacterium]|jgi:CRISPR-associated protein Cmr3|nr:type III-B CRISPR module-associated Cmr3 family protein [Kofleriaceae bacterium]
MTTTTPTHVALIPRDGMFCKDGRGWQTSTSNRGHALDWPWPSTVLGALRTASGRREEAVHDRRFTAADWQCHTADITLARTLVLRRDRAASWEVRHRVWPAPADARRLESLDVMHRLQPVPPSLPTLGRDDDVAREALWVPVLPDRAKPVVTPRWWSEARFATWLAGDAVPASDAANAFDLTRRIQAHVQIRPEVLTAADGALYSHDVLETWSRDAEWAIGVEVALPSAGLPGHVTLGSDGRLAGIEPMSHRLFDMATQVVAAFRAGSRGLRIVTVTPACFAEGWLPDGIARHGCELRGRITGLDAELVLRAAIVPRPNYISGWDIANNRPKPTAAMVPAGAVYFFERADGAPIREADARRLWLAAVGERTGEGFGRIVPGTWNFTRSET